MSAGIPTLFSLHTGRYHIASENGAPICGVAIEMSAEWVTGRVISIDDTVLCAECAALRPMFPALGNPPECKPLRQVYIIHMTVMHYYKIGVTYDITKRFKTLQSANPCPLKVVWQSPFMESDSAYAIEHHIHQLYRHVRVELGRHREWFKIGQADIKSIKEAVLSMVC